MFNQKPLWLIELISYLLLLLVGYFDTELLPSYSQQTTSRLDEKKR